MLSAVKLLLQNVFCFKNSTNNTYYNLNIYYKTSRHRLNTTDMFLVLYSQKLYKVSDVSFLGVYVVF